MPRIFPTGIATADGSVEIPTRGYRGNPSVIRFNPTEAAGFAELLGTAAHDTGHEPALMIERSLNADTSVTGRRTKGDNARLDWQTAGFHYRLVIDARRVREIADILHDLADRLPGRNTP